MGSLIRVAALLCITLLGWEAQRCPAEEANRGSAQGPPAIAVTVVGTACMSTGKTRNVVEAEALADARQKGREYAISAVEAKTSLANGAPERELMAAYAEGTVREIGTPAVTWLKDQAQGECCEVQVMVETLPKLDRTTLKPVRNEIAKGIYVDSDPRGAEVFLDGRYKGKTPIHLMKVLPGWHELEVGRVAGRYEYRGAIELKAGKAWKNLVVLGKRDEPQLAPPSLTQEGATGKHILDDEGAGNAPAADAPPQPGVAPPSGPAPPSSPAVAKRQLVPVSVMTEPVRSRIYLDEKYIADSPAEFLASVGPHHLRLVPVLTTQYETVEREVQVSDSNLNTLYLRLNSK